MDNEDLIFGKTKKEEDDFLFCDKQTDPFCKKKAKDDSFLKTNDEFLEDETVEKHESKLNNIINDINSEQKVIDITKPTIKDDFLESAVPNDDFLKSFPDSNESSISSDFLNEPQELQQPEQMLDSDVTNESYNQEIQDKEIFGNTEQEFIPEPTNINIENNKSSDIKTESNLQESVEPSIDNIKSLDLEAPLEEPSAEPTPQAEPKTSEESVASVLPEETLFGEPPIEQKFNEELITNTLPTTEEPAIKELEPEPVVEEAEDIEKPVVSEPQNIEIPKVEELQPIEEELSKTVESQPVEIQKQKEPPITVESQPAEIQKPEEPAIKELIADEPQSVNEQKTEDLIFDKALEEPLLDQNKISTIQSPIKEERHSLTSPMGKKEEKGKEEEAEENPEDDKNQCDFNLSEDVLTDLETINEDFMPEFEAQKAKEEEEAKRNAGEIDEQLEQDVELKPIETGEKLNDIFNLNLDNIEEFLKQNSKEYCDLKDKKEKVIEKKKENDEKVEEKQDKEEKEEIKEEKKEEKIEAKKERKKEGNKKKNILKEEEKSMPASNENKRDKDYTKSILENFELDEDLWNELNLSDELKEKIKKRIKIEVKSLFIDSIIPLLEKTIK